MSDFNRELDLSGEVCPFTFVKSKLALEEMAGGEILAVTVDNPESAGNVPRSMELEGHQIIGVDVVKKGVWQIVVKKVL